MKKNIVFLILIGLAVAMPLFIYAQNKGLVPCTGIDCSLCSFFELFVRIFDYVALLVPVLATGLAAYGGYLFIVSRDNPSDLTKAKGILLNTVIGVAIFYASYVLASELVNIVAVKGGAQSLGFDVTKGRFNFVCSAGGIQNTMDAVLKKGITLDLSKGYIPIDKDGNVNVDAVEEDRGVVNSKTVQEGSYTREEGVVTGGLNRDVKDGLKAAADELIKDENGKIAIVVTSGYRSIQVQKDTANAHCTADSVQKGSEGKGSCERLTGKSIACIPDDTKDDRNCPHTTGQAVDVSGINSSGVACVQHTTVTDDACQQKVIQIMKEQHFCVLKSPNEPWHFEKPKVSNGCE